ncbi:MAG: cyanophycinase [Planctomycetota bacterium]|nr:MAG: cyanophycinase [Planctomycetota bacterium]
MIELSRLRGALASLAVIAFLSLPVSAQGFLCLEGGGDFAEGDWETGLVQWALDKAGPEPTVVVLSVGGSGGSIVTSFLNQGATTVLNLPVFGVEADNLAIFNTLTLADIVWIADESLPLQLGHWGGTLVELALEFFYSEGGVLGASGSGAQLLGGVAYDASNGDLDARDALVDAFDPRVAFTSPLLDVLPGILVDEKFTLLGRLGRLPVLVARAEQELQIDVLGIGVDRRTGLCIEPNMQAEVIGEGSVTLLHDLPESRIKLEPGVPPTVSDLRLLSMVEGYRVDLTTRAVLARAPSAVLQGPPISDPIFATLNVQGQSTESAKLGDVRTLFPLGSNSHFLGALQVVDGQNMLLRTIVSPHTWKFLPARESTVGGVQYALSQSPHFLAILLDEGVRVRTSEADTLLVLPVNGETPRSAVLIDTFGVTSTATSTYVAEPGTSVGPRQSAALEDARLHVLRPGDGFDSEVHTSLFPEDAWIGLGDGLGGSLGEPVLTGDGVIIDFNLIHASLTNAAPGSMAFLILGFGALGQSFKTGTLVPTPDSISMAVPTDPSGEIHLSALWPGDIPRGFELYAQFWIADSTAGVGWAASNGMLIQAP